ncbi:MAG: hypothetical protein P8045_17125 [Candidatus Thiodiazotropha sp.]
MRHGHGCDLPGGRRHPGAPGDGAPLPPGFPDELRRAAAQAHPHLQQAIRTTQTIYVADIRDEVARPSSLPPRTRAG